MLNITETIMEKVPQGIITEDILMNLCEGSADSRYGVIKRAVAKGELVHIKRGLYILAEKYQRRGYNLFEIAQYIYGPSYISFESALAFHGCIPESVYAVTSACAHNGKDFHTPYGMFIYKRIPYSILYLGVDRIKSNNGTFFIASPLKAIVDYVYAYQKRWRGVDPLLKSLRIEEDNLHEWDYSLLEELRDLYKNYRVQCFLKGLKKDLKL